MSDTLFDLVTLILGQDPVLADCVTAEDELSFILVEIIDGDLFPCTSIKLILQLLNLILILINLRIQALLILFKGNPCLFLLLILRLNLSIISLLVLERLNKG